MEIFRFTWKFRFLDFLFIDYAAQFVVDAKWISVDDLFYLVFTKCVVTLGYYRS